MYIGNDLQIAHPSYKIIDDISSGFNGSTTSFALQVSGATPVPFPISTQQVMISVNGVVQEPDPNGGAGFKLLGSNIVFSSAPANGHAFFGVINAGADYVTAGSEFPDGSATAPSFTFQDDQDTGWYRNASGDVGYSSNGTAILNFDGNGLTIAAGKGLTVDTSTLKVDAANNRVGIGLTAPVTNFHVKAASPILRLEDSTDPQGTDGSIGKIEFYGNDGSSGGVDVRSYIQTISTNSTGNAHALVIGLGESNNSPTEKIRILGDGKVGIGVTSPGELLHIKTASGNCKLRIDAAATPAIEFYEAGTRNSDIMVDHSNNELIITNRQNASINFRTNGANERARIDSAGRLLVGNTGVRAIAGHSPRLQIQGTEYNSQTFGIIANSADSNGAYFQMSKQRSGAAGGDTIVQNGDNIANLVFTAGDGTDVDSRVAEIKIQVDGTPGANDTPGRISFLTTPDGAQSTTERMRIDSSGRLMVGQTSPYSASGTGNMLLTLSKDATSRTDASISNQDSGDNASAALVLATHGQDYILEATGSGNTTDGARVFRFLHGTSEFFRLDNSGRLLLGTTTEGEADADNLTIADSGHCGISIRSGTSSNGFIMFSDGTSGADEYRGYIAYRHGTNVLDLATNGTQALTIDSSQNATFAGTVSDSKGDLRKIIQNTQGSAYTLVAADAGKHILASGTVTIPNSVFAAGDAVTIINNTGSDLTITKTITTMYNTADGSSANRTLATRGMATILFVSGTVAYISGAGLS
jgi:hypothetical protein